MIVSFPCDALHAIKKKNLHIAPLTKVKGRVQNTNEFKVTQSSAEREVSFVSTELMKAMDGGTRAVFLSFSSFRAAGMANISNVQM